MFTSKDFAAAPKVMDCLTSEPSDDTLLLQIQGGDEQSFRMLVERHIDRAYAISFRMLGQRSDAEDIAQEAFLRVWTARDRWEPGRCKFSTWLYRVVVNLCIDARRRRREVTVDEMPDCEDGAPSAVSAIHATQMSAQIEQALSRLPEQQRAAIVLSYYEDRSNSEVAEILETTVSAVESLLKRGRQKLREVMRRSAADARALYEE